LSMNGNNVITDVDIQLLCSFLRYLSRVYLVSVIFKSPLIITGHYKGGSSYFISL
jgi:hypothetical protein